jgi:hypothetical protein
MDEVRKIPVVLNVTREQLDDARDPSAYVAIRKALGWPLTPEQDALWQKNVTRAAEAKEERKMLRESTPTVPVTVDALLGLLWDTFRLDEDDVRHMLQPWCSCEQDGDNGMWRCEHYNDTF